jgi:hypothetical protein
MLFYRKLTPEETAQVEASLPKLKPEWDDAINPRRQAYNRWHQMMRRCYNSADQAYKNYGGRGIAVCQAWHDFDVYYKDTGTPPAPAYTLDRINNDGDYSPENVRWASKSEQCRNRRVASRPKPSIVKIGGRYRAQVRVNVARTFGTEAEARAWGEAIGSRIAAEADR